ncbi:MAG: S8 family serine peptidase, partial [Actinobacteria bacterium]|nr:S8 family serine peptidase [Actinomycetota bacterium]
GDGAGYVSALAEGISYAVHNGAKIINVSLNTDALAPELRDALAQAAAADVLVVASAGNTGRDLDTTPSYPASSSEPNVLSVAALTRTAALASFSARGRESVDTAVIGDSLPTTAPGRRYTTFSGTSAAAAVASGVAALARAEAPDLSAAAVRKLIMETGAPSSMAVAGGAMRPGTAVRYAARPGETAPALEVQVARRRAGRTAVLSVRADQAAARTVIVTIRSGGRTLRARATMRGGAATLQVRLPARSRRLTVKTELRSATGHRLGAVRSAVS